MKIKVYVVVDKDNQLIMDPYSSNNNLAIFEIDKYAIEYQKKYGGRICVAEISVGKLFTFWEEKI